MSAQLQAVLARRLGRVRSEFQDAYLVFNWSRWNALTKREQRLAELLGERKLP